MLLLMMLLLLLRMELCLRWRRRLLLFLLCLASAAARRGCCRRHLLQMGRFRAFEDAAEHIVPACMISCMSGFDAVLKRIIEACSPSPSPV